MIIEIHLPVSKAIKCFLTEKFGEAYKTSTKDWFGMHATSLLQTKSNYDYTFTGQKKSDNTDTYKFMVSVSHQNTNGFILTPNREDMLRKFIESVFRDACFSFALMSKEFYNIEYKNSIINFLNYYNIDETEGSYIDALMRDFNRKKAYLQK